MFNELWDAIILAGTLATGQPVTAKPIPIPAPDQYERRILPGEGVCLKIDMPALITQNRIMGTEDSDMKSYTYNSSISWCKLNDVMDADVDAMAARPFVSPIHAE